jgi:hypothetical protein
MDGLTNVNKSSCLVLLVTILLALLVLPTQTFAQHYVFTDDDGTSQGNTSTFYSVASDGALSKKKVVHTSWNGIAGGFFGMDRVAALDDGTETCTYLTEAVTGQVVSIGIPSLKVTGSARGSKDDTGVSNGIGLAVNSSYIYASFSDASTIGTFELEAGCKMKFVQDLAVKGLQGGVADGMAVHDSIMVVTYGDGSIESFDISGGVPVSNGDEQNSTGSKGGTAYPNGVDITSDGHFAIFGDTANSTIVEVSDISSGKLDKTVVYHLGRAISSSNVLLSPDETLLYISNTQGGTVSAAFFDATTGKLTPGCTSNKLKNYGIWTYLGGLAQQGTTGTGGDVYAAEYGNPSAIAVVNVESSGGRCTLHESSHSPVSDPASPGLLSIGSYPPRGF